MPLRVWRQSWGNPADLPAHTSRLARARWVQRAEKTWRLRSTMLNASGTKFCSMDEGSGQESSSRVAVQGCSAVLGAAVEALCAGDSFFLRQMKPAMGTAHHVGGGCGWRWFFGGWFDGSSAAFEGPNCGQYDHQPNQVFHAARPIKTSKTKREPA